MAGSWTCDLPKNVQLARKFANDIAADIAEGQTLVDDMWRTRDVLLGMGATFDIELWFLTSHVGEHADDRLRTRSRELLPSSEDDESVI